MSIEVGGSDGPTSSGNAQLVPGQAEYDRHDFYMTLALAMEAGAKCLGSQVGCVIIKERRILGAGYNGTASGFPNCDSDDHGCARCALRSEIPGLSGRLYDICLCVHAEQNAMTTAARFGIGLSGSTLYTTLRPCFTCFKEVLQVGFAGVYYRRPWIAAHPDHTWVNAEYDRLTNFYTSQGGTLVHLVPRDPTNPVGAELGGPSS
jgi:dCMP deaminase